MAASLRNVGRTRFPRGVRTVGSKLTKIVQGFNTAVVAGTPAAACIVASLAASTYL
ncbi:MAG TPA: hypothetical protein VNL69_01550 [Bacteroidota bacterium]|nr:hypothetical protein [Bacteroidota bacterium]